MTSTIISSLLTTIALSTAIYWMASSAAKKPRVDPDSGDLILEYGLIFKGIGVLGAIVVPLLIAVALLVKPPSKPSDPYLALGLAAAFMAAGSYMLIATRRWFTVSPDTITYHPAFGAPCRIEWGDVQRVAFRSVSAYVVITSQVRRIKVSRYVIGINDLLDSIDRHVPEDRYHKSLYGLHKLLRYERPR